MKDLTPHRRFDKYLYALSWANYQLVSKGHFANDSVSVQRLNKNGGTSVIKTLDNPFFSVIFKSTLKSNFLLIIGSQGAHRELAEGI
jgi:hypothetical protein